MADETRQNQDVQAPSSEADGTAAHLSEAARPAPRRPYASPKLRYLGKVAELTFTTSAGSKTDGGSGKTKFKFG